MHAAMQHASTAGGRLGHAALFLCAATPLFPPTPHATLPRCAAQQRNQRVPTWGSIDIACHLMRMACTVACNRT